MYFHHFLNPFRLSLSYIYIIYQTPFIVNLILKLFQIYFSTIKNRLELSS
nr:MAG TPA: hypothetical protein [Caudoviricetes sp.]DAV02511.1 MAG TPA: hypothetical protein [Caudoviricetes sp.]